MQTPRRSRPFICVACLAVCFFLTGCYFAAGTGKAPWKKPPVEQSPPATATIAGEWSEPVNGIRMRMMHILPMGGPTPEVALLFFAQNTLDHEVDLPMLKPEPFVKVLHRQQETQSISDANLRITAQPMDGQAPKGYLAEYAQMEQQVEARNPLQPGEIRVFAVKVVAELQMKYLHQIAPDTVYADHISWPGLDHEASAGRWRLHAVFRPSGFNDPDAKLAWVMDEQWVDKQIDLPVTVLKLDPWHYHEDGQSIQQLR